MVSNFVEPPSQMLNFVEPPSRMLTSGGQSSEAPISQMRNCQRPVFLMKQICVVQTLTVQRFPNLMAKIIRNGSLTFRNSTILLKGLTQTTGPLSQACSKEIRSVLGSLNPHAKQTTIVCRVGQMLKLVDKRILYVLLNINIPTVRR